METEGTEVLVISQLPPPVHGSTLMTRVFLETLDALGLNWTLVDRRFSKSVEQVGRASIAKFFAAIDLFRRLFSSMRKSNPSVVVFFATTRDLSFLVDYVMSEILRLFKAQIILYPHTVGFEGLVAKGKVFSWCVSRMLSAASEVIVLSDEQANDIRAVVNVPITAIPNTLPALPDVRSSASPADKNVVLFLSNLIPGKGVEDFLSVVQYCSNVSPQTKFLIAGAVDPELRREIETRIASDSSLRAVELVGRVDDKTKWSLFSKSKLLVFPSHSEAMPLVPMESLASGVPVVCYRVGAVAPIIESSNAGIVIDPFDETQLCRAVESLLLDADLLDELSRSAYDTFELHFAPGQFQRRWSEVLESHLTSR